MGSGRSRTEVSLVDAHEVPLLLPDGVQRHEGLADPLGDPLPALVLLGLGHVLPVDLVEARQQVPRDDEHADALEQRSRDELLLVGHEDQVVLAAQVEPGVRGLLPLGEGGRRHGHDRTRAAADEQLDGGHELEEGGRLAGAGVVSEQAGVAVGATRGRAELDRLALVHVGDELLAVGVVGREDALDAVGTLLQDLDVAHGLFVGLAGRDVALAGQVRLLLEHGLLASRRACGRAVRRAFAGRGAGGRGDLGGRRGRTRRLGGCGALHGCQHDLICWGGRNAECSAQCQQ